MKVFILYPPLSTQERFSSQLGHAVGHQIPLGVFYLAACLRNLGHTVEVVDAEVRNLDAESVLDMISHFAPDVLGISSTTVAFHRAVEIAELVEERFPQLTMVLGGPHVSASPKNTIETSPFKIGVVGEGETTFPELLEALKNGSELTNVHGIVFKQGEEIIQTPRRPLIEDLDTLPFPAYDMIPNIGMYVPVANKYKILPFATIISSRGCPNQCTFCDQAIFGRKLRQRSPENIAAEIIMLYRKFGVREFTFADDTFTLNSRRIPALFSLLDAENIRFPWSCFARVNTVDEEILRYMKSKGCWNISFGIESGNQEILKTIKKNITLEQVEKAVSACSKIGMEARGFFMLGHPGETPDTMEQTIRFATSLPLSNAHVTINTPFPGTTQYSETHLYGTLDTTDWKRFSFFRPVFVPHGLSEEQLKEAQRSFMRRFYLRPRIIAQYCRSFISPTGFKRMFQLAKALPFLFKKNQ